MQLIYIPSIIGAIIPISQNIPVAAGASIKENLTPFLGLPYKTIPIKIPAITE